MHNQILMKFSFNHQNFSTNKPVDKDINYELINSGDTTSTSFEMLQGKYKIIHSHI